MINNIEYPNSCCFSKGVECAEYGRKCDNCGWNPEVNAKRVKEIRVKLRAEANENE